MQTAKKQKMNRDELSLYEHEEVRSWCTENEEGADLNLIVVNNEKKSIRIPIKSKIIEYSSGFVKDRPDKECSDLYVIGFEAIDVIRVLKYLMPLSEYSTSNMGSHVLKQVIKTAKYLDVRLLLDKILRKEVYRFFETLEKIDFLTIWRELKRADKSYVLNEASSFNERAQDGVLHFTPSDKWNAMFNWENYELLFDVFESTSDDFTCLFSKGKSWNLIGLLIFFPTVVKVLDKKVAESARMLKCLRFSYDLCKKIVQEPGSILTKKVYTVMDLKIREVHLNRHAFNDFQLSRRDDRIGKVNTGFRNEENDLIGFISRDTGVCMFSYVDMMAKDNLSLIPSFFLQAGMFLSNQNSTHVPPTTASDTAVVQRSVDPYNLM